MSRRSIGDVVGGYLLAHVAAHEGIHAVEVIAGEKPQPLDYNQMPRCTYCVPQVAATCAQMGNICSA